MRISIKMKFSIFLAALLLLTVFILSLLVLQGIQRNQQAQFEGYLEQQAETANVYLMQSLLAGTFTSPQTYLDEKGRAFANELALITGQSVVLYDEIGNVIAPPQTQRISDNIQTTLAYALSNKTAYLEEGNSLYYMAPLRGAGGEQVGVVQFYYSLAENQSFYNNIKNMFLSIGSAVFVLSFILAYFYFNFFASGIISLKNTVERIRHGHFEVPRSKRRDEIGELREGIAAMSSQIQQTMTAKDEEREKLALAVSKLSLLDQQQKQFIGNVSHEFKTPLTSIKAYLDLLDMYPDDEKLLETAKATIQSETLRLYEMVEKVLQLAALDKYEFEYQKETMDLRQVIYAVLKGLKGKMDKFGITLDTDLNEVFVEADRDSLTLVLVNLLDNAVKYNKPNGRISVRSGILDGKAFIEIQDSGIGIPEDVGHKIFQPFYTVDKNRARQSGGAGLGLSLAKQYAESQDGSLLLVGSNADGTLFRLSFPVSKPPVSQ